MISPFFLVLLFGFTLAVGPAPLLKADDAPAGSYKIRLAWGGGEQAVWQGRISLSGEAGQILAAQPLGLETDAPGAMPLSGGVVNLLPRSPRAYDGVDLVVKSAEAILVDIGRPEERPVRHKLDVARLLTETIRIELDDRGNVLVARRAPGDALRVRFPAGPLIFSPGQEIPIQSELFTSLPQGMSVRVQARIEAVQGGRETWSAGLDVKLPLEIDDVASPTFRITAPTAEGVYDLVITATQKRLTSPLFRHEPDVVRRVQFVVLDRVAPRAEYPPESSYEIDLASDGWWGRLARSPSWRPAEMLPAVTARPVSYGAVTERTSKAWGERPMIELAPGAWQSAMAPITHRGTWHELAIEYPATHSQSLSVNVLEEDHDGRLSGLRLSGGVRTPPPAADAVAEVAEHRFRFVPTQKRITIVLANRHPLQPAVFGRIRVRSVTAEMDALAGVERSQEHGAAPSAPPAPERLIVRYLDAADFGEQLGATQPHVAALGRTVHDWKTFYQAGARLVDHLRHGGFNAAAVTVAAEGSALYPSDVLQPTPRFDTGVFLPHGQDPRRKDVVELWLQMCDRAGVKFIPVVRLDGAAPLASGPEPQPLAHTSPQSIYRRSPADPAVGQFMRAVVGELAKRYGHHPSFAGVGLTLQPGDGVFFESSAGAPAEEVAAYAEAAGRSELREEARHGGALLLPEQELDRFRAWRVEQITRLHRDLAAEVRTSNPNARLFLSTERLLVSPGVREALRPRLMPNDHLAAALADLGFDPAALARQPGVVVLRPFLTDTGVTLADRELALQLQTSKTMDLLFGFPGAGTTIYHPAGAAPPGNLAVELPGAASRPLAWEGGPTLAGHAARRLYALAESKRPPSIIFDGGSFLPSADADALRDMRRTLAEIPATPAHPQTASAQPVIAEVMPDDRGGWRAVMVNASPWGVRPHLELAGADGVAPVAGLGFRFRTGPGSDGAWDNALGPYEIRAIRGSGAAPTIRRLDVTLPIAVQPALRHAIHEMGVRVKQLENVGAIDGVKNPDFETADPRGGFLGWRNNQAEGVAVAADGDNPAHGQRCLTVESDGPVAWIRSDNFPVPRTGKLWVFAWARCEGPGQPDFRIGVDDNRGFYRFGALGRRGAALTQEWRPYLFQLDSIPPGVTELSIAFDLMGPGKVWVDHVQAYDLALNPKQQNQLTIMTALADFHYRKEAWSDCAALLESYWPQFLKENVAPPAGRIAQGPERGHPSEDANGSKDRRRGQQREDREPQKSADRGFFKRLGDGLRWPRF